MPLKTLTKHLINCPDKSPHFKHCEYNMNHVMPESELKSHEESCPDRTLMNSAYTTEETVRTNFNVENAPSIQYEETWDGLEQTSETLQTIQTRTTSMKATHGTTRSERKQHRKGLHKNYVDSVQHKEYNEDKKQQNNELETKLWFGKRPNKKN